MHLIIDVVLKITELKYTYFDLIACLLIDVIL